MSQKMLKFTAIDNQMPDKRKAEARRTDFNEIYGRYSDGGAVDQASRCSQCGIPFCQVHCPVSNNIPDWLKLTAEDRLEEAYEISSATNNLPEVCGRICPQDRLCEGNCVLEQSGHGSVTIGAVERYITDTAWERGWVKPPTPKRELGRSVGIIGAGPAGIAAAEQLRRRGYETHVYDRYDRVGGLLIYGIPSFKLEKDIVTRRAELLAQGGVEFHLNFEVGKDATMAELRERHDAVLIATGVYKARDIKMPGAGLEGIFSAMDYLTASNRKGLGDTVPAFEDGTLDAAGRGVVVIGGGDTASEWGRTAVRQGAKSVRCIYRRDRENMPGSRSEVTHAEEEGVEFVWLAAPEAFVGDGTVDAVRCQRIHLGVSDATGRQTPEPIEGSSFNVDGSLVIKALGFDPEDLPAMFGEPALTVNKWGTIKINPHTLMSEVDGVFAAGDIVRGASLVVWAIHDGRLAAEAMHNWIEEKALSSVAAE
ncbi:MAG: NAD(P)-dependent oxidoreductase [Rhodospirillales bacterium]|nr:NAD(P)-dependent oxidoreductase [Rhodospirillales bacterium]